MNTEDTNDKAATPVDETAGKPVKPRRERRALRAALRLLLIALVLAALAAAAWFGWQQLKVEKARYDAALADIATLEDRIERLAETRVAQDDFDALGTGIAAAQAELGERMNALASGMDTLRDAAQGGRRDLIEAEVEYLLRIAADELYLTQDVDTAIYALQAADDRLSRLADPRLNAVRQLIADHLAALRAVNLPDVSGMAIKLGSLMRQVSALPLRQARHARAIEDAVAEANPDAGWWQRTRAGIARVFDKLVIVRRAEPPPPLLTPQEHFFLYRNVELQLAAARSALLAGDAVVYRQSLELAREWLNQYFDVNDPAVASAVADLTGLLGVALQPELPSITPALDRFRELNGDRRMQTGARAE